MLNTGAAAAMVALFKHRVVVSSYAGIILFRLTGMISALSFVMLRLSKQHKR